MMDMSYSTLDNASIFRMLVLFYVLSPPWVTRVMILFNRGTELPMFVSAKNVERNAITVVPIRKMNNASFSHL